MLSTLPREATRTEKTHSVVVRLIQSHHAKTVLDAASGNGALATRLIELGLDVACLDASADALFPPGAQGIRADLDRGLPIGSSSFDCVTCVEGIEHVENFHHLLREFRRILRPGGCLIVTTPNILSLRSRWKFMTTGRFAKFSDFRPHSGSPSPLVRGHLNPVGFPELEFALVRAGFSLEAVHANHLRGHFAPLAALVRFLLGLRRPKHHPHHEVLLSNELLFGENLILCALRQD